MKNLRLTTLIALILTNSAFAQDGWNYLDTNLSNNEHGAIYVLNEETVFIIADGGQFLKTIDGGETWSNQDLGIYEDFYDVFFWNNDFGIAVGSNGTLIKTENGGNDWLSISLGINSTLTSVFINNLNSIWVVGSDGEVLFSNDSGNSWAIDTIGGPFNGVFFRNENEGYITGADHLVYATDNGGIDWSGLWFGSNSYFSSISKTETYLYILADNSVIYKAISATDWGGMPYFLPEQVKDLYFQNDNMGFCITSDCTTNGDCYIGIYKSTDSGETWHTSFYDANPPKMINFQSNDIKFATNEIGYALSGNNVLKTIDGGIYGLNEFNSMSLSVYPNPTAGRLTISGNKSIIDKIEVKNVIGQDILNFQNIKSSEIDINISNLQNGIYFLNINDENGNNEKVKVIKI